MPSRPEARSAFEIRAGVRVGGPAMIVSCAAGGAASHGPAVASGLPRAQAVAAISTEMTLGEILKAIGQPNRDIGSGVFVLEWDLAGGQHLGLSVSSLDPSVHPFSVRRE